MPRRSLNSLLLLLLLCSQQSLAQYGLQTSAPAAATTTAAADDDDFEVAYAEPWIIGQNVCAYLRTAAGRRFFTTCFPYKQTVCGADTQFQYDCCPGFGHDARYEGYASSSKWQQQRNCLKKLSEEDTKSTNSQYLASLGLDANSQQRLRDVLAETTGEVTVFLPYNNSYQTENLADMSQQESPATAIAVRGGHFSTQLLNDSTLSVVNCNSDCSLRINRYSNGMVTAQCRRLVSADHVIDGRAVLHLVDGNIFKSTRTLGEILQSKYSYFWSDFPSELQQQLLAAECGSSRFTILVPPESEWNEAKTKSSNKDALVREHILSHELCSSTLCTKSTASRNLNDERLLFNCDSKGVFAQPTHEFRRDNPVVRLQLQDNGDVDLMATNGVVYSIDNVIPHSSFQSFNDLEWENVPKSCVQLDPNQKYIFLIPTPNAWKRFNNSKLNISSEETMQKFSEVYNRDANYRCLVKKYHVLEVNETQLQNLSSPIGLRPGAFRTLAQWEDDKSRYGRLFNYLHFQKSDSQPRLHFQFAPVRAAKGFELKEGTGFMVDWVNIPPHESSYDFFQRRNDLSYHRKMMQAEARDSERNGGTPLYKSKSPLQLIIATKDEWYKKKLEHTEIRRINTYYDANKNNWNATDFLRLNWANLYYWIGDLGYLAKGERVSIQSGHPSVKLQVYRDISSGKFYVWKQYIDDPPLTIMQAPQIWSEIVEFNHFKTDSIIWIVDKPLYCSLSFCKNNRKGKLRLPWSFAMACGDFVKTGSFRYPAVKAIFGKAAGKIGEVVSITNNMILSSGIEKGTVKNVTCFGIGMLMTRDNRMDYDHGFD